MPCCAPARGCGSWPPAASRWASPARRRSGCRRCRSRQRLTAPTVAGPPDGDDLRRGLDGARRRRTVATSSESEAVRLFVERARAAAPAFALTDRNARGRGADLPAPGRDPAGDRAGGGARRGPQPGADRGPAGRPVPPADRRQSDGPAALPDAAGADRLEPRPARRARAGPVAPAGGVRRRLDPRGGRGGLRGRRARAGRDPRPPVGAGGEVAGADRRARRRGPLPVPGDAPGVRGREAARRRRGGDRCASGTATGSSRSPSGPSRSWPGRGRWRGCSGSTRSTTTCARRWPGRSSAGDAEGGVRLAGALFRFWSTRGFFSEGHRWLAELLSTLGVPPSSEAAARARAKALQAAGRLAATPATTTPRTASSRRRSPSPASTTTGPASPAGTHGLGCLARVRGDYAAARALSFEALGAVQELGDAQGVAETPVVPRRRRLLPGRPAGRRVPLRGEPGRLSGAGQPAGHRRVAQQSRRGRPGAGRSRQARRLEAESLASRDEIGDRERVAIALAALAGVAAAQGAPERALRLAAAAMALREAIGKSVPRRLAGQIRALAGARAAGVDAERRRGGPGRRGGDAARRGDRVRARRR